ncbi:hypothetical protein N0V88_005618 [Collariella sp. IMI 366227]|nr:hypothetical protein N0V88_005618 [Collariella sp. IMI 366227]
MDNNKIIIAFDLYGTLLSTESIADELANHVGEEHAVELAALWRRYQLEYTWRINSMGTYRPFNTLTQSALEHAAAELNLALSPGASTKVMAAYNSLEEFDDVDGALDIIKGYPPTEAYIFSNGTPDMITSSGNSTTLLKWYSGILKGFVSVDDVMCYKPDRRAYEHLLRKVGRKGKPETVWLVSSNPFDIVGAVAAGLKAVWVDRERKGWVDQLGHAIGGLDPTLIVDRAEKAVWKILRAEGQAIGKLICCPDSESDHY